MNEKFQWTILSLDISRSITAVAASSTNIKANPGDGNVS